MTIYYIHAEDAISPDFNCDLFVDATSGQQALDLWLTYAKENFAEDIELCGVFELPQSVAHLEPNVLPWSDSDGVPDLLCTDADVLAYAKDLVKKGKLHSLHRRYS